MTPTCSFSPVHLRYSAALRGLVPTDQTDGFTYAALGTMDTEEL